MTLDVRTLFLAVAFLSVLQVAAFTVIWVANRKVPGLGEWLVASAGTAAPLPLYALEGMSGPAALWLKYALPTALHFAACGFLLAGACRFTGRRVPCKIMAAGAVVTGAGFAWFLFHTDDLAARIHFASLWSAGCYAAGAYAFWTERRRGLRLSARVAAVAATVGVAGMLYRVAVWGMTPLPEWITGTAPENVTLALCGMAMLFVWTFCVLFLVSQFQAREAARELAARHAAEQELLAVRHEIECERAVRLREAMNRELHDGLGGITATLAMLAALGREETDEMERARLLQQMEEIALEGSREVRNLMSAVETGIFRWEVWLADLEKYARLVVTAVGASLVWRVEGRPPEGTPGDRTAAASLQKVVMEAVHNVARHSRAQNAEITFAFAGQCLFITVRDDGAGAGPGARAGRADGRGLANIQSRVSDLCGTCSLADNAGSGQDHGTVLRFLLPLPLARRTDSRGDSLPTEPDV